MSACKMGCMQVLVVDDERAVRSSLRRALALEGYRVVEAEGGEDALERLRLHAADAVVLDVLMPGVDGLEVCRRRKCPSLTPASGV